MIKTRADVESPYKTLLRKLIPPDIPSSPLDRAFSATVPEVGAAPSAPGCGTCSFWAGLTSTISQRSLPRLPIPLALTPHP